MSDPLQTFLTSQIPSSTHSALTTSILPTILSTLPHLSTCLRNAAHISTAGSTNTSGDAQLNVDLLTNSIIHAALRTCPAVASASSEEDEGENAVAHDDPSIIAQAAKETKKYTVAFDPLDGSSIIPANWTVGSIFGIWEGETALNRDPRRHLVAAVLGVLGPRTSAIVAVRIPGHEKRQLCFEVGFDENAAPVIVRERVAFTPPGDIKTRYFAPANLRASAQLPSYKELIDYYMGTGYTLRYSGGLVPDVVHALVKGHGVYVSPVSGKSKAKLRVLYEVGPVALIMECAGGKAVDAESGEDILAGLVTNVDQRAGIVCGTAEEVDRAVRTLLRRS